ncbi:MAG: response regulator [Desulfuromonas sp.]|nr:response regulator [Desulfuromonas sp.]
MKYRAIVFEDDDNCRQLLCLILEKRGYEVISSADPTICPAYASHHGQCASNNACGDFLLTDQHMPHMTGLDFIASQERRDCKGAMMNKAVLSGSWTSAELSQANQLGCKVFRKPYRVSEINAWLDEQEPHIPADRLLTPFPTN